MKKIVLLTALLATAAIAHDKIDDRTKKNMHGIHGDLQALITRSYQVCPSFTVIDGLRTIEEQKEYYAKGTTTTLKSKHLTGHAFDFIPNPLDWGNINSFKAVGECIKTVAERTSIPIQWGGDWKNFKDYPHIELKGY